MTSVPITVRTVLEIFDRVWEQRYETNYGPFSRADAALAKRLITQHSTATRGELETWVERYIAADDEYVLSTGHRFGTFIFRLNAYRARQQKTPLESAAADFIAGRGSS